MARSTTWLGTSPLTSKWSVKLREAARRLRGAFAGDPRLERGEPVAALDHDVGDVDRHAAGQRHRQRLRRRRPGLAVAVEDDLGADR